MSLKGLEEYYKLYLLGHTPQQMGFAGKEGDISRLNARVRLARSFRGLRLDGYTDATALGYDAFFQVFLTHSALERYMDLVGMGLDGLGSDFHKHGSGEIVETFFKEDSTGKLFDFLHAKVNSRLKLKLSACKDGTSTNVGEISAAIRHIFAHGYLTANVNRQNPRAGYRACKAISDFLLNFIDDRFSGAIADFCRRGSIEP
jgi:hypothetical protein